MNERAQGIALVTALAILVVVGILVAGSFLSTQLELGITKNDTTSIQAQYVADAGLEKYKAALFQYYRYVEDTLNNNTTNPTRTACYSRIGEGLDWLRNGTTSLAWNSNKIAFTSGLGEPVYAADGTTIIGRYNVTLYRDLAQPKLFTLVSEGNSHGARATMRAVIELNNTGVLQQAIFAGHGQANKFINGGATIRGGIYVVGDSSNQSNTVFNSNGNFSQLNSYDLTSGTRYQDMVNRVSSANQVADNLCASLRVQYGQVDLNGSVKLGDPSNKLLGVYIGQDVSQDLVVNSTLLQCTATKGICTDNGPSSFDLNPDAAPTFPTLDSTPSSSQGCDLASWRDCIHRDASNNGITLEYNNGSPQVVTPSGTTLSDLSSCMAALTASGTRTVAFGTDAVDCTVKLNGNNKYGFDYQPGNPGSLKVYGNIDFKGFNLQFNQPTQYFAETQKSDGTTVYNASWVVEKDDPTASSNTAGGDIDLNANMLTGNTAGYPDYPNHVLAFVAENDVFQGGSSVMAPIYAGGTYRIVSNNTLIGSVVSDYFCTTGAGGTTNQQKKQNSKTSTDKCNAGQNAEVDYVNTGNNKPAIMRYIQYAGVPIFAVRTTETR